MCKVDISNITKSLAGSRDSTLLRISPYLLCQKTLQLG